MSAPTPARPRRRRWVFVPLALLLLLSAASAWAYVRGTSADAATHDPAGPSEPPTSQLHRTEEGHLAVRAAVVVDAPRQKVWAIVTDFAHYSDVLPYLKDVSAEREGDGVTAVRGEAKSAIYGYWTFSLKAHEEKDKVWRVWWREGGAGEVRLNHGGWALSEHGTDQTLLVLELEAEVTSTPTWLLRNFFLYRLRHVVAAVKARAEAAE